MSLIMDLSEDGLAMFFKPYQITALKALWKATTGLNSRQVWQAVGEDQISRASIINFLNAMTETGLLKMDSKTGKGGHHGVYTPSHDEKGTKEYLAKIFKEKLKQLIQ
jgi:predicted transcriptional regulator